MNQSRALLRFGFRLDLVSAGLRRRCSRNIEVEHGEIGWWGGLGEGVEVLNDEKGAVALKMLYTGSIGLHWRMIRTICRRIRRVW